MGVIWQTFVIPAKFKHLIELKQKIRCNSQLNVSIFRQIENVMFFVF